MSNLATARTGTRRLTTETKASSKTTELIAYIAIVVAIAITSVVVGNDAGGSNADPFSAYQALQLITFLTIGYLVARGLAKSGSRDAYDENDSNA